MRMNIERHMALIIIVLVLTIYFFGTMSVFTMHEMSHVEIFDIYGIESDIVPAFEYPNFLLKTVPRGNYSLTNEEFNELRFLQAQVEVGYQYGAMTILLSSLAVILTILEAKRLFSS